MNNNMNHNNGNNNHPNNHANNSNNQHHDWKDDVRETITEAAQEAVEDARDLASEAKQEFVEMTASAKAKLDAIPPVKRMEMNHFTSVAIALIIGLIAGLAIGWSRGNMKGLSMQNNHGMSAAEMMEIMSANLNGLSGTELEQQFISDMIAHHQGAIDMATKLVGGKDVANEQLRAMAAEIIRAQSTEIEQMKAMQR